MAHECPDCGRICYCNGDIDDINMGEDANCLCPCWMEDDEDDPFGDDDHQPGWAAEDPDYDLEKEKL